MILSENRTFFITGADSGIGRAAAEYLSKLDATLLLLARNHVRGERTLKDLKANSNADIHLFIGDLSSQESVFNLAKSIKEKFKRIDVLINNAGARFSKRYLTVDGIEATFAVNYLSRFLLTYLLLDLLKDSEQGRIINVSGESHRKGKINFNDLTLRENYSAYNAAAQSKLADVLFTYSLARKLANTSITVNCLHPGTVATNIVYSDPDVSLVLKFLYKMLSPFFKSTRIGAETIIHLAVSPEVSAITGKYFINKKEVNSSPSSYEEALADKLWEVSEQLTHLTGKTEEILI